MKTQRPDVGQETFRHRERPWARHLGGPLPSGHSPFMHLFFHSMFIEQDRAAGQGPAERGSVGQAEEGRQPYLPKCCRQGCTGSTGGRSG